VTADALATTAAEPPPPSPADSIASTAGAPERPGLLVALRQLLGLLGYAVTEEALIAGLPVTQAVTPMQIERVVRAHGFEGAWQKRALRNVPTLLLPCLVLRSDGSAAVVTALTESHVHAFLPEMGDAPVAIERAAFEASLQGDVLLLKRSGLQQSGDARSGIDLFEGEGHWFWRVIRHFRAYYVEAGVAAVLINVLALASVFFTMNVYDRVVANQAYTTLWTLAIGVCVALLFEYFLRNLRAWLLDNAGKKADLLLGSSLFAKVQATRLEARPQSAGAFANMLKEYESLRDFATSTVLVAISDLPFLLLFLAVLYVLAGPLALVPILAVPLIVAVGLSVQPALARNINQNLRESSVRHGVLIESLEGAETLKSLRAEGRMQQLYERASAITAITANKSRLLSNAVTNFQYAVNTLCTVAMVVWGVYLIGDNTITQGVLIGSVMLASRALGPLATLNSLAIRLQQARSSYRTLNEIMKKPSDRESGRSYATRANPQADLAVRDLKFAYGPNAPLVIRDASFNVRRGEKLAILGRVGSGKTTLLKLMAGLYLPSQGLVLADDVDIRQIDPAEYRRSVLYVGQHAQMFFGTLRDNLKLGAPAASDEAMMRAASAVGVHAFAQAHPLGYDMMVGERGENLSGGQRQAIALARAMLVEPSVLLLDEPTAAMDSGTEAQALQALFDFARDKTVVLVTHKLQLLDWVQRVMVIDHGVRAADGPRDAVMQAMREGRVKKVDPTAPAIGRRAGAQGEAA
jgi:ATP-binding cassette subfamily C protein LapB